MRPSTQPVPIEGTMLRFSSTSPHDNSVEMGRGASNVQNTTQSTKLDIVVGSRRAGGKGVAHPLPWSLQSPRLHTPQTRAISSRVRSRGSGGVRYSTPFALTGRRDPQALLKMSSFSRRRGAGGGAPGLVIATYRLLVRWQETRR